MNENHLKAIEASIKAGEAIMEIYQGDFDVEYKDDASPLTQADKKANAANIATLRTTASSLQAGIASSKAPRKGAQHVRLAR